MTTTYFEIRDGVPDLGRIFTLTISAGDGVPTTEGTTGDHRGEHCAYDVTVLNETTRDTVTFTYHASIADYEAGKTQLIGDDLLYAFWSFVQDATAGEQSHADFCADYGYDEDSRAAHATWGACVAALADFHKLVGGPMEPGTVIDLLAEAGIE